MRKIIWAFLFGIFCACEDKSDPLSIDKSAEVTYLLYMVGQNDLAGYLSRNVEDLKKGYEKSGVKANILVYEDISSVPELYLIDKAPNGKIRKITVKTYPDQYSVDPEVMKNVIHDVFVRYPSIRKGITFSSHADGSLYRSNTVGKRSFGYEGTKGVGMNITDIREALENCPYFDMIMFDACMMASVETAYELKDRGHYFLATPNSVPVEGFPYEKTLPCILKMDAEGLKETARIYMEHFHQTTITRDDFVAISLSDMTQMDSLAFYMDSLFQDCTVQERPFELDRGQLQHFENGKALYDYGEWVDSLGVGNRYTSQVRRILDKVLVYKGHSEYSSVNDWNEQLEIPVKDETFCGLNTYVPNKRVGGEQLQMNFFTTLRWYRDAGFWRSPFYRLYE